MRLVRRDEGDPDVAELNADVRSRSVPPGGVRVSSGLRGEVSPSIKLDKCVGPPASRRVARAAIERETRDLASYSDEPRATRTLAHSPRVS